MPQGSQKEEDERRAKGSRKRVVLWRNAQFHERKKFFSKDEEETTGRQGPERREGVGPTSRREKGGTTFLSDRRLIEAGVAGQETERFGKKPGDCSR